MYLRDDRLVGVVIDAPFNKKNKQIIFISLLYHRQRDIDAFANIPPDNGKYKLNSTINFVSSRNLKTARIIAFELN